MSNLGLTYHDAETAETRLFRVLCELSQRVLHSSSPEQRTELRAMAETFRLQLVKLIEAFRIPSEADYVKHQESHRGYVLGSPGPAFPPG